MSENALEQVGGFDLLLTQNVEHIWERIFLSLDYESLRNCLHVCRAWWEIFRRESFRAKMVAKFPTEMWMDTENMERKIWRSRRKILAWTANSEPSARLCSSTSWKLPTWFQIMLQRSTNASVVRSSLWREQ